MDWFEIIFEVIDMRSFSNLWYWIALAVVWSTASHWVLGVPFDMVLRARRKGGQAMQDLEDIVRVNVNRILLIGSVAGLWLIAFGSAILTILGILGFGYRIEFAQAVFLIGFPMSFVGLLSISTASLISEEQSHGELLCRRLTRHRFWTQLIGILAIFVTSMWGMYKNVYVGPFGN
ncbi:component of SufBCD complex [Frigidibacter sp. ROC022]|uniref:component of SufBCD complex n=1 Tax=Frigidibacter sp. ROC022 TaxID=2971796 RepID=UPI00215B21D5|nr:component of SufBCD complex [Frigidibacter sp. ROC022]MCR8725613.1 component of SufBCD complex [Frigidibacter sp. ROC022]